MSEDKHQGLGDRVFSLNDIPNTPIKGGLPHPQGIDPWADAESVDSPLTTPPHAGGGYNGNYDPLFAAQQAKQAESEGKPSTVEAAAPRPAPEKRPVPPVTKLSRRETQTLNRFRRVFGLSRIDVVPVALERRDPDDPSKNVKITFGLRGVSHEDFKWIVGKIYDLSNDDATSGFAAKVAYCSIVVAHIDGEPIWKVFGFEPEDPNHVSDPMYPRLGLRFAAAEALCDELQSSWYDVVEDLYNLYEENIGKAYLAKRDEKEGEDEDGPLP